ncbi:S8 family serine peptidase [Terribacillus sp. DMT04]|uniref:S8 family serine peptidase n=1 Tax=Terribacillus sp. DMT04 TaxID=2850441 RepID=UPI001C2C2C12|nr:S8 family serine peptidase [Terribacillus sp. DMT04]QXE01346.1 S8 family serine peptidase [Terribacillus sp. DMT04]
MRKPLAKQLAFASLLTGSIFLLPVEKADAQEQNQVIVVYENKQGEQDIKNSGAVVKEQYDRLSAATVSADADSIEKLKRDPDIKYVENNVTFSIAESGEAPSQVAEQWNLASIHAASAWEAGLTGKGVKIAVLDSGIAPHPELAIAGGYAAVDYTTSYADDKGHGTHVAGIIGAKHDQQGIDGIAPDAALFAVKVLDEKGEGTLADLLEGIDWAIANNMDIVNLSMGSADSSEAMQDAMNKAYQAGLLLVGASGNEGAGHPVEYPAAYDAVIGVSATDARNNSAAFSSVGSEVEFAAPGKDIVSTYLGSEYRLMSGTSQATSHVTAMLALLKQQYPNDTNVQLRQRLQQYTADLGQAGRDELYGYGFVQYPQPESQEVRKPAEAELATQQDAVKQEVQHKEIANSETDKEQKEEQNKKEEAAALQELVNDLGMTEKQLAELFTKHDLDLYSYSKLKAIKDIIYQDVNDISVHFVLEENGMSEEELDELLAANNQTLADFTSLQELKDYIAAQTEREEKASPLPGVMQEKEESNKMPASAEPKLKVEPIITKETPEKENEEIVLSYKTAEHDKLEDKTKGEQLPDTASSFGNVIAAGVAVASVGALLYVIERRRKRY